jgi:hypothetical protein
LTDALLAALARTLAVALTVTQWTGCSASTPLARITAVDPARAYTDGPVVLRIGLENLRPSFRLDVDRGTLGTDLDSVRVRLLPTPPLDGSPDLLLDTIAWDGGQRLWAKTRVAPAARMYALEVTGPLGEHLTSSNAFEGLGPDPGPPSISMVPPLVPDSIIGEGQATTGVIVADDGLGTVEGIHWETTSGSSGNCPPTDDSSSTPAAGSAGPPDPVLPADPPPAHLECPFSFTNPKLRDQDLPFLAFGFTAWARDQVGQQATLTIALRAARLPGIVSFAATVGGLGGYQPFVVRGNNFLPKTRALLDGVPLTGSVPGGELGSENVISGWTPPRNRAGPVMVQVVSDAGTTQASTFFTYVSAPSPREVQPNHGPRTGGTRVTVRGNDLRDGAIVYVGATRATRQPLSYPQYDKSQNKIVGCLPPGSGTVTLWVYDAITGDGELPSSFTYDDASGTAAPTIDPACR